jgi:hypothetical protein
MRSAARPLLWLGLPTCVRLSRERARQVVRQDCSFAKEQESPPALLVVVQASDIRRVSRIAPGHRDTSPGGSCGTPGAGSSGKGARMLAGYPLGIPTVQPGPRGSHHDLPLREVPSGNLRSRRTHGRDVRDAERRERWGRERKRNTCRCGSSVRGAGRARDGAQRPGLSPGGPRGSR